jgi:hypothetical protein
MNQKQIKRFQYKGRLFHITFDVPTIEGNESIQLNEEIIISHVILDGGKVVLEKSEPIIFACRDKNGEIEISMQYEGFPLEVMMEFIKEVEKIWKKKAVLRIPRKKTRRDKNESL